MSIFLDVYKFLNDVLVLSINNDGLIGDFLKFHQVFRDWPRYVAPTTFRACIIKLVKERMVNSVYFDLCMMGGVLDIYPRFQVS